MNIKFYGTRGSTPITGENFIEYGGGTTCLVINMGSTHIMVDCGSGALDATRDLKDISSLNLLITHAHLDHISGIVSILPAFFGKELHIYGKRRNGLSIKEQLNFVMSEPLWPADVDNFGKINFHDIGDEDFYIDDVHVRTMDSNHPGGCTLYSLERENEKLVIGFDFCHSDGFKEKLIDFSKDADYLIYDGSMSKEEFELHPNWGHSTPEVGIEIAKKANIKNLYITHHGVRTDDELCAWEDELRKEFPTIRFAKSGTHRNKLSKLMEVGINLTAEKDMDKLLELIVRDAMEITGADGGTLYLLKDDGLNFKIMITKSKNFFKGGKGNPIDLPPVKLSKSNISAASALENRVINVHDAYDTDDYDFSGTKKYDSVNGYRTKSVMSVPMRDDRNEVIGVIQLINATNQVGEVIEFGSEDEKIIEAIASQAAISITNMENALKVEELLFDFVRAMSTAIDHRTAYNANHTKNMVKYAERFLDYYSGSDSRYNINSIARKELLMSIWLHDLGKIITPLEVMDKATRLGKYKDIVNARFDRIALLNRLDYSEGRIDEIEFEKKKLNIIADSEFIKKIDTIGFLTDDMLDTLNLIKDKTYTEIDGTISHPITDEEYYNLSTRKGTLTPEERKIMEEHVVITKKMLSEFNFPRDYKNVPFFAGSHHEYLNGKGYPDHLDGSSLPWESRLITIIDIFDAITAIDRPYKPPMPLEKALDVLSFMVKDGQIDGDILEDFKKAEPWK